MLGIGGATVALLAGVVGMVASYDYVNDPLISQARAVTADAGAHADGGHDQMHGRPEAGNALLTAATKSASGVTQYTCPMHPNIVTAQPGSCPICGMHLVKAGATQSMPQHQHAQQSAAAAPIAVTVGDAAYRQMGIAVEVVTHRQLKPVINTYAVLESDQGRATSATPKFEGWIKRLGVAATGERVRQGQVLYEIYSAEAQQRQRDYLDLLTRRDGLTSGGMAALEQSNAMLGSLAREIARQRDRLREAEIPPAVMAKLDTERRITEVIPVLAQRDGIVSAINIRPGGFAGPSQPVLTYGDPRGTSATLSLYPDQLPLLAQGGQLTLTSDTVPGWRATAPLRATTAEVDPATRKARVRVTLNQVPAALVAGTFLHAIVEVAGETTLTAPRDAVLRTGHGSFVMVALGEGRFVPTEVRLGKEDAERVEIVDGLAEGAAIAVNGQFLLGAEASLAATRQRMGGGAAAKEIL